MSGKNVLEFTDDNFASEVLESDVPVLVDFWAEWCMPCRMLAPTIDEIANDYAGKVKVGKVDTDANRDVSLKFGISAIPTIMLFQGGQVVRKFVGVMPKKEFVAELQKVTAG
jgi:thioredoxin 1